MQRLINSPVMRFVSLLALLFCALPGKAMAAMNVLGEYSYLHVSFSSIWHIFIFILILVMMPFILMIVVAWRRGPSDEERMIESLSFPEEKKHDRETKEHE
jgi:hypothetical protein